MPETVEHTPRVHFVRCRRDLILMGRELVSLVSFLSALNACTWQRCTGGPVDIGSFPVQRGSEHSCTGSAEERQPLLSSLPAQAHAEHDSQQQQTEQARQQLSDLAEWRAASTTALEQPWPEAYPDMLDTQTVQPAPPSSAVVDGPEPAEAGSAAGVGAALLRSPLPLRGSEGAASPPHTQSAVWIPWEAQQRAPAQPARHPLSLQLPPTASEAPAGEAADQGAVQSSPLRHYQNRAEHASGAHNVPQAPGSEFEMLLSAVEHFEAVDGTGRSGIPAILITPHHSSLH